MTYVVIYENGLNEKYWREEDRSISRKVRNWILSESSIMKREESAAVADLFDILKNRLTP